MIAFPGAGAFGTAPCGSSPRVRSGAIIYALCKSQNIFSPIQLEGKELESSMDFLSRNMRESAQATLMCHPTSDSGRVVVLGSCAQAGTRRAFKTNGLQASAREGRRS